MTRVLLLVAAGLSLAAENPRGKTEVSDHDLIQGTWKFEANGKKLVISISETRFGAKVGYTLRPKKKLKEIDLVHTDPNDRQGHLLSEEGHLDDLVGLQGPSTDRVRQRRQGRAVSHHSETYETGQAHRQCASKSAVTSRLLLADAIEGAVRSQEELAVTDCR